MWRCGAEARGEVRSARRGGRVMEEGREEARWDGGPDGEKDEAVHLRSLVISHRVCFKHHVVLVCFPPLKLTDGSVTGLLNSGPLICHFHFAIFPKQSSVSPAVSRLPRKEKSPSFTSFA